MSSFSTVSRPTKAELDAHLRDVLEAVPEAILEVDAVGHIMLVNVAAEQMFGYSPSGVSHTERRCAPAHGPSKHPCSASRGLCTSTQEAAHGQRA